MLQPDANAWGVGVTWGADTTDRGDTVVWGTADERRQRRAGARSCGTRAASCGPPMCVWGTTCGGSDCASVVWGTGCGRSTGSDECDNVVWGTQHVRQHATNAGECDNVVWGTTADDACTEDDVVWAHAAWARSAVMKTLPLAARALRLRRHRPSARFSSSTFFPLQVLRLAVAVPAAADAVVDHLGLQGQAAARPQRIDDVGVVLRWTSRRCCCSGRTRR